MTVPDPAPERRHLVPVAFAAHVMGRSHRTIRTWVRAGTVRHDADGEILLVHVIDVARESKSRPRRRRRLPDDGP
jgi:hypothetical protein